MFYMTESYQEFRRQALKDYLSKNNILIKYIYNMYGYPVGVVAGIGRDKVGWSYVASSDREFKHVKPHQLPSVQYHSEKAKREGKVFDLMNFRAYKALISNDCYVHVPKFNKVEGVIGAIEVAENGAVEVNTDKYSNITMTGHVPSNPDMVDELYSMILRTRKVKRFQ